MTSPGDEKKPPRDATQALGSATGTSKDRLIGTLIAERFLIRLVLGEGGMGKVYLAEDQKLNGRRVALKLMGPKLTMDAEFRARFEREAVLQANLPHPQIIQIQDMGESPEGAFIVMEYSEGRSLSRIIKELGPMPLTKALEATEQILEVLDFAHGQGVIHRDLKPSNILVEERPGRQVIRLLDFGIAKLLGQESEGTGPALTRTGFAYGTLGYMAPEQARGETELIDHRADIYSAGIMLHEMLTGHVPSPPESRSHPVRYAMWLQENSVPSIADAHPNVEVAEQVDAMLRKALRRDPEKRYHSALGFLHDIREFRNASVARTMEGTRVTTPGVVGGSTHSGRAAPLGSTSKLAWALAAFLLVASGVLGFMWNSAQSRVSKLENSGADPELLTDLREKREELEKQLSKAEEDASELKLKAEAAQQAKEEAELEATKLKELSQQAEDDQKKAVASYDIAIQERDAADSRKEELKGQVAALTKKLKTSEDEVLEQKASLAKLTQQIAAGGGDATLRDQAAEATRKLTQAQDKLKSLNAQVAELESRPTRSELEALASAKREAERQRDQSARDSNERRVRLENLQRQYDQASNRSRQLTTERNQAQSRARERDDWIRRLTAVVPRTSFPNGLWPPPGVRDATPVTPRPNPNPGDNPRPRPNPNAAATLAFRNDTGGKIRVKWIKAQTNSGLIDVLPSDLDMDTAGQSSVTLPQGTTSCEIFYEYDYRPVTRRFRNRKKRQMQISGSSLQISLVK